MKITQLLFLLLITFALKPLPSAAQAASDPVLDTNGQPLQSDVDYYILPAVRGNGGGVSLASTGNETCPLDVVQDQLEESNGLPLTFTPANPMESLIRLSADHNVKFSAATICAQSTVWRIEYDELSGLRFVTTNGVEGNPGRETLSNWFSIRKYEDDYKLVYCPTVCNICRPFCGEIGIHIQDGIRQLALSDVPFKIMFKKA